MKIVTRGKGKGAVAAAAYRAAETIKNERDGQLHDYSRKKGVAWLGILLPDNAPEEYKDRSILWNAVEKIEKASNSQLAREIQIALPRELHFSQYFGLILEYVKDNFTNHGMCADIAIHTDKGNQNPHCHILLTMRPFNEDKTWGDKQRKVYHLDDNGEKIYDPKKRQYKCGKVQTTDWDERHKAEEWRASWADKCNKYLAQYNCPVRIDHRSFARQGLSKIPTIHLGAAAHQMEQRGIQTERGNINRAIEISNRKLHRIEEQLNDLQGWLVEERAKPKTSTSLLQSTQSQQHISLPQTTKPQQAEKPSMQQPQPSAYLPSKPRQLTFADIIADSLSQQGQTISTSVPSHQIRTFLKNNDINSYAELEQHLKNLMGQQRKLSQEFSPIRDKQKKLAGYIKENDNYQKLKKHYRQYQQDLKAQKPWKKKAFEENNR